MLERLPRGLVLKSETYEKSEAFYTIILKNRFIFPWINKTANLYKNWEDDSSPLEIAKITRYDFRNYLNYLRSDVLKFPDDEEIIKLRGLIEDLPKKKRKKIWGKGRINLVNKIEMSPDPITDISYNPTIKKISDINSKADNLLRAFSRKRAS